MQYLLHEFADAFTASIYDPLQHLFLNLAIHPSLPYLWCDICDYYAHFPADFKLPTVLISFSYYD